MPTPEPSPGDVTEFEERACIVSRYDEECDQVWLDDDEGNPFAIGMDEWATCVVQINAYEAARLLAPFEQPEVAELLAEAEACESANPESPHWECAKGRAADLRGWAACEGRRIEAENRAAEEGGWRELSDEFHGAIRALHPDMNRRPFIDDAVALVLGERDEARKNLAEAEAKLARVERLRKEWLRRDLATFSGRHAEELAAALADAGGESEVPDVKAQ